MDLGGIALLVACIFLMVILVACSAFFSASETAFTGMNRIKIKNMANDGNKKAAKVLEISDNFDKLLTTILVGNNFVNIFASSLMSWICSYWLPSFSSVIISTLVTLFVILLFGEITPKTLANNNPETWALRSVGVLSVLITIFSPITYFFNKPKQILAGDGEDEPTLTEDELVVMVDEIEEQGELEKTESELIKSAIEFDDRKVSEILVPRVDIFAVDKNTGSEELKDKILKSGFSRIPIYDGSIDKIIGVVYRKDFFKYYFETPDFQITECMRPVKFIPETATLQYALNELQKSMVHMLIIVDEYGGTLGIITMEDVLEELIGEVYDETDEVQNPIVMEPDGSYTALGEADVHEIMEFIGTEFDLGEYDGTNVSGFIQYKMNRIPLKDDIVNMDGIKFVVRSVRKRRVKLLKIIVTKPKVSEEGQ